jgi:hypothetical protein
VATAQPTVWSGYTFQFTRPSNASPAPVDMISPSVHLARAATQGIYNAAKESAYNSTTPTGTRWATNLNNAGKTIAAANHADLQFASWLNAYGGFGIGNVIEGRNAVVHLVEEDIYLDLRFTSWADGRTDGGGGFGYLRAVAPAAPMPTGDYNGNGAVDAADYALWRDTIGQMVGTPGQGADGSGNGTIDAADYNFWQARFGNSAPAGNSAGLSLAVPEPMSTTAILAGLIALHFGGCRRARSKS